MRRKVIFVLVLSLLALFYAVSAILNNGEFMYTQCLRSSSKQNSVERGMFVDKKYHVVAIGDSIVKHQSDFTFWMDKDLIVYQFGLSPLHYTKNYEPFALLNITSLKDHDNWVVSKAGEENMYGPHPKTEFYVDENNRSLNLNFFWFTSTEKIFLGELRISWD